MFDCCWLDVRDINMLDSSLEIQSRNPMKKRSQLKIVREKWERQQKYTSERPRRCRRKRKKEESMGLLKLFRHSNFFIQTEHLFKIFDTSAGLDVGRGIYAYSRSLPIDRTNLASQNKKNRTEQFWTVEFEQK